MVPGHRGAGRVAVPDLIDAGPVHAPANLAVGGRLRDIQPRAVPGDRDIIGIAKGGRHRIDVPQLLAGVHQLARVGRDEREVGVGPLLERQAVGEIVRDDHLVRRARPGEGQRLAVEGVDAAGGGPVGTDQNRGAVDVGFHHPDQDGVAHTRVGNLVVIKGVDLPPDVGNGRTGNFHLEKPGFLDRHHLVTRRIRGFDRDPVTVRHQAVKAEPGRVVTLHRVTGRVDGNHRAGVIGCSGRRQIPLDLVVSPRDGCALRLAGCVRHLLPLLSSLGWWSAAWGRTNRSRQLAINLPVSGVTDSGTRQRSVSDCSCARV